MALDWLPVYPSRFHRPSRAGYTVSVQNVSPLPNPAPPTFLTWHPTYPDQIWAALRRPALQSFRFAVNGPPIADLRWQARYPDRLVRPALAVASQTAWFGPNFNFLRVPVIGGWRPTYPSQIWQARRVPPTQTVYPIQGSTILAAVPCIEWNDETATRPELTPEAFTRPQMTCQSGGGYLLLEDGGHLLLEDGGKILLEDQSGIPCESFVRPTFITEDWC